MLYWTSYSNCKYECERDTNTGRNRDSFGPSSGNLGNDERGKSHSGPQVGARVDETGSGRELVQCSAGTERRDYQRGRGNLLHTGGRIVNLRLRQIFRDVIFVVIGIAFGVLIGYAMLEYFSGPGDYEQNSDALPGKDYYHR